MGSAIRIVSKGLAGLLLVGTIVLAVVLAEAHLEIRSVTPELPDTGALDGLSAITGGPVRIAYVNTASQTGGAPATLAHPAFLLSWADGRRFLIDLGMERDQALAFGRLSELAFGSDPITTHGSVPEQVTPPPAEPGASGEPLKAAGRDRYAAPCAPLRGADDQPNVS